MLKQETFYEVQSWGCVSALLGLPAELNPQMLGFMPDDMGYYTSWWDACQRFFTKISPLFSAVQCTRKLLTLLRFSRAALLQKAAALPVPFVAQSVDLVGKFGQILVGAALVVLNDPQQALTGAEQPLEHGSGAVCTLACPLLHTDLRALLQADCTLGTDGPLRTVVRRTGGKALLGQGVHETVLHLVLAVDHEHPPGLFRKGVHPAQQTVLVRVAGHAGQLTDLGLYLDGLAEQLDRVYPFDEGAPQGAHGLKAHEQDRAFRPPQVVLEVVADASGFAHSAGRQDDLGRAVGVDHAGVIAGHADAQPRHVDGVDALFQQRTGLGVKAVGVCIPEDAGGFGGQRAVNVDREVAVSFDKAFFLDLPQKIQHLLRAAHRKAGHHHVAAPVKGALQNFCQFCHIVRPWGVVAVTVGGLHEHIVRLLDISRVLYDGLIQIADIAGEHQLCGGAALGDPQLYAGRAQQVPHVHEPRFDARGKLDTLAVLHTPEQAAGGFGILYGVHGLHRLCAGALALAVFPLGFKLLNMRRVPQHDAAQLHGGDGGVDPAPEAIVRQQRQKTGMVDMGMGDEHKVDLAGGYGQGLVLVHIFALLHAVVDEETLPRRFQHGAAAGHLVVRA